MVVRKRAFPLVFLLVIGVVSILFYACGPYREFHRLPPHPIAKFWTLSRPVHNPNHKTVFILADNRGTEIFDLMAPFALLSGTNRLNVYVVAPEPRPILLRKGLFILPHYTLRQVDSIPSLKPDAVVIPALSDSVAQIIGWIQRQRTEQTLFMSVCEGSRVAAKTGMFDGKQITTHAFNLPMSEREFPQMNWINGVSVTHDGQFLSTAGVSSAVEGTLVLVERLLNQQARREAMQRIRYPSPVVRLAHMNDKVNYPEKWLIARKILLKSNKHVGVLLRNGVNELDVAAVLDTYHRSFPASIQSFTPDRRPVISEHGLVILPTGDTPSGELDELHVPMADSATGRVTRPFNVTAAQKVVWYQTSETYIFDRLLEQLAQQYDAAYARVVALLLDYNQTPALSGPKPSR